VMFLFFCCLVFFFFSSSRRHTRSKRDWSSDVCSSDLYSVSLERVSNCPAGITRRSPGKAALSTARLRAVCSACSIGSRSRRSVSAHPVLIHAASSSETDWDCPFLRGVNTKASDSAPRRFCSLTWVPPRRVGHVLEVLGPLVAALPSIVRGLSRRGQRARIGGPHHPVTGFPSKIGDEGDRLGVGQLVELGGVDPPVSDTFVQGDRLGLGRAGEQHHTGVAQFAGGFLQCGHDFAGQSFATVP